VGAHAADRHLGQRGGRHRHYIHAHASRSGQARLQQRVVIGGEPVGEQHHAPAAGQQGPRRPQASGQVARRWVGQMRRQGGGRRLNLGAAHHIGAHVEHARGGAGVAGELRRPPAQGRAPGSAQAIRLVGKHHQRPFGRRRRADNRVGQGKHQGCHGQQAQHKRRCRHAHAAPAPDQREERQQQQEPE